MTKILKIFFLILSVAILTILIYRWIIPPRDDLDKLKEDYDSKIDSLNLVIRERDEKISEIETFIQIYEQTQDSLKQEINKTNNLLMYYKDKGRFQYEFTSDDLHRELNALIKQRLYEVDRSAKSISR